jgi:hypothetical protein
MKKKTAGLRTIIIMADSLLLLVIVALWTPVYAADVIVIANPSVPVDTLSPNMIKAVFLGKKTLGLTVALSSS